MFCESGERLQDHWSSGMYFVLSRRQVCTAGQTDGLSDTQTGAIRNHHMIIPGDASS